VRERREGEEGVRGCEQVKVTGLKGASMSRGERRGGALIRCVVVCVMVTWETD